MPEASVLHETSLVQAHRSMGAKLVDFGGWNMPLHYGSQMEEHHHVRTNAGMFDVSHMTVIDISSLPTNQGAAKSYLQHLLANDVAKLTIPGKALYSGMLNHQGGVIDDLIVYWLGGENYRVIVNCATREKDLAWMRDQSSEFNIDIRERDDMAMVAVQGPNARAHSHTVLGECISSSDQNLLDALNVFQGQELNIGGDEWFVARTGYTGEDGYEILLPNTQASTFWQKLADVGVAPCGLGARDTLRLEAGMNLYGHEMDDNTSPLVANMGWSVAWEPDSRDFVGREVLEKEKNEGVRYKLVGLVLEDKGVIRAGQTVQDQPTALALGDKDANNLLTGIVTSGSFSPTLTKSIALARVPVSFKGRCFVQIRKKCLAVQIVKPNFVRHGKSVL